MNIPLYARMNEFAPVPTGNSEADVSHAASPADLQGASHDGQDEAEQEESGKHGSLFEQCTPQVGKFAAKSGEGEVAAERGDMAQRTNLENVPDLMIGSMRAEGSLTDGYKLHEVSLFDSGSFERKTMSGGISEVEGKDFAQISPVKSNIVPSLELDYSGAPEAKSA